VEINLVLMARLEVPLGIRAVAEVPVVLDQILQQLAVMVESILFWERVTTGLRAVAVPHVLQPQVQVD
jgi:hypothetical protein